jgi:UrcA family protein
MRGNKNTDRKESTKTSWGESLMRVAAFHISVVGCLAVSGIGMAQQPTDTLVVEAPHVERTTQPGAMGIKRPAMSIAYKVNYSDLNLATHSGAVELEKRIKASATQACDQLAKLYPETVQGDPPCVTGAVKTAMARAQKLIAAAENGAK